MGCTFTQTHIQDENNLGYDVNFWGRFFFSSKRESFTRERIAGKVKKKTLDFRRKKGERKIRLRR